MPEPLSPEPFWVETNEGFTLVEDPEGYLRPASGAELSLRAALDAERAKNERLEKRLLLAVTEDEYVAERDRLIAKNERLREAARAYLTLSTYDQDPRTWNETHLAAANDLGDILASGEADTDGPSKELIDAVADRLVKEHGETLKKLGDE